MCAEGSRVRYTAVPVRYNPPHPLPLSSNSVEPEAADEWTRSRGRASLRKERLSHPPSSPGQEPAAGREF